MVGTFFQLTMVGLLAAGPAGGLSFEGREASARTTSPVGFFAQGTAPYPGQWERGYGSASLSAEDRHTVRRLQREYVELWMAVLSELHPARSEADLRVRAHACFGLINSTPHSVRKVRSAPADSTVRGILESMASSALTA